MLHHENGGICVGAPGSYQYLLSGLEDLMKGKPLDYEVHHLVLKIKDAGSKIGLSIDDMRKDVVKIIKPAE